ncbi:hypothetical protein PHSY_006632 [Pseudozyma hubeiensis SY62]|uniref:ATP-dependent DNA helicase n=1 Tax=Pseudozyma hubeiensis (strain SY62) TaxID=1305764 RepID=R9PLP6_PSEHS|nr:hypothetical protein PHSY_006632 [Pseudozyma hubeiensis SY62]GAC99035.1 hypothetical protein PHSY_006632 [Pseudozyma hubeiensis SY62]
MTTSPDEFDDIDFDDFGLDDSALLQLDQIESNLVSNGAAHKQSTTSNTHSKTASDPPRIQTLSAISNTDHARGAAQTASNGSSSWANRAAASAVASTSARPMQRVSSTSSNASNQPTSSGAARQMNLFGKPVAPSQTRAAKVVSSSPGQITISSQSASDSANANYRLPWQTKMGTKTWDREAYLHRENAKNRDKEAIDVDALDFDDGAPGTNSPKGKGKAKRDWDADSKYTNVLPPAPAEPRRKPVQAQPQKCKIDLEAGKTWIYPTNMESRDYQYNIVQKALFNNVLVALPTGLGKTFIAAVVILNFFRWYPDGKIMFLAPSRPLVDQQKTACHRICGLPWECAIDLTGSTAGSQRGDYWATKRIFYMTPQTFENDMIHNRCDPRDVVCIVVDEAHRARGKYAYGSVIGRVMEVNPHFRVLALSATPGKDSDSVQEVVDQLHINQIEIRTEEAIDVQRYVFRKREEIINVSLGKDLNLVKENWAKLMQTQMDPLMKAGLIRNQDPVLLHPFAVNAIHKDRSRAAILHTKPWLQANIKELSHMALSMQYLMEQSPTMFYNRLKERSMGYNAKGTKTSTAKQQMYANKNTTFAEIIRELELMQDTKGRILHPKMLKLRNVLIEHFDAIKADQVHNAEAYEVSGHDVLGNTPNSGQLANFASSSQADTRVMVFCSYRECCDEIVAFLNDSGFKATEFVGQSKAKSGKKGMSQKDQERVITDFKAGKYNVLVATSIGEEGLDIGSVDLTVCYEAVKDSIRMLQRIGRTGRKREGKIAVLVSEGREQHNWQHSKDNYKAVQKEVDSRMHVELFDDVDRMVPDHISPQPVLKEVEQPEFDPSMVTDGKPTKASRAPKVAKPKKDPKRNMPEGAIIIEGFRKASTLTKRKRGSVSDEDAPPSNETHSQRIKRLLTVSKEELEAQFAEEDLSLDLRPPKEKSRPVKRIPSTPPSSPEFSPPPSLLRRPAVSASVGTASDGIRTPPVPSASSSSKPLAAGSSTRGRKLGVGLRSSGRSSTSSGTLALRKSDDAVDALIHSDSKSQDERLLNATSPRSRGIAQAVAAVDDDDDEFADLTMDMSMENAITRLEQEAASRLKQSAASPVDNSKSKHDLRHSSPPSPLPAKNARKPHPIVQQLLQENAEELAERDQEAIGSTPKVLASPMKSSMGPPDSVPRRAGKSRSKRVIVESPDAASTDNVSANELVDTDGDKDAASSSPIKAPVKRGGRLQKASSSSKLPPAGADTSPTAAKSRTRCSRSKARITSDSDSDAKAPLVQPVKKGKKAAATSTRAAAGAIGRGKKRKITNSPTSRALFQYEAERSTDEELHGERDENDSGVGSSDEDDSDREAVGDFVPTQAPRGYHQQSVYMQSMLSQAPAEFQRLRHAPFPGIGGKFGDPATPRRTAGREVRTARQGMSSESRRGRAGMGSEDFYSEDSFVVNDEEEIVYDSQADALPDSSPF